MKHLTHLWVKHTVYEEFSIFIGLNKYNIKELTYLWVTHVIYLRCHIYVLIETCNVFKGPNMF